MRQLAQKQKTRYVILPRGLAGKSYRKVDLRALRKEISRQWKGPGAVEEIRAQRQK